MLIIDGTPGNILDITYKRTKGKDNENAKVWEEMITLYHANVNC